MRWLVVPFSLTRQALLTTFAPRRDATSAEIRRHGLITVGLGMALFVLGGLLLAWTSGPEPSPMVTKALVGPIIVGDLFLIVGGYRAFMGREPDATQASFTASLVRIAVGTCSALFFVGVLLVSLVLGLTALGVD